MYESDLEQHVHLAVDSSYLKIKPKGYQKKLVFLSTQSPHDFLLLSHLTSYRTARIG